MTHNGLCACFTCRTPLHAMLANALLAPTAERDAIIAKLEKRHGKLLVRQAKRDLEDEARLAFAAMKLGLES